MIRRDTTPAYDLLLIEGRRFSTDCMRQTDTVARVGGDEFVALASEIDGDRSTAEMQAERIAEKLRCNRSLVCVDDSTRRSATPVDRTQLHRQHWRRAVRKPWATRKTI